MIEINLLPPEYRPKAAPKFVMPHLQVKKTFLPVAAVIFGAQLLLSLFAVYMVVDLAIVKAKTARIAEEGSLVAKKKAETVSTLERLRKIESIVQKKYCWSSLLNALSNSTSKGVWLTGFGVLESPADDKKSASKVLKLDGSVVGQGEETAFTGKFIKELKANALFASLFSKIELSNLVQKKIRDFDVYDFSIYCTFKPEKAGAK